LIIVAKPWCHMLFWCPLQLHSNCCDQVVVSIVEKYNSHFKNQSQNPRCVVVIIGIPQFPMDTRYPSSRACTYMLLYATFMLVPYAIFFVVAWNYGIVSTTRTWSDMLPYCSITMSTTCMFLILGTLWGAFVGLLLTNILG
jgi:hypothetical protein